MFKMILFGFPNHRKLVVLPHTVKGQAYSHPELLALQGAVDCILEEECTQQIQEFFVL